MKKHIIPMAVLLLISMVSKGQTLSRFRLKAGVGNHQIGFPYQNIFQSSNPAILVGGELRLNKSFENQLVQSLEVRAVSNEELGQSMALATSLNYQKYFRNHWFAGIGIGLGLVNQRSDGNAFELLSNGEFQSVDYSEINGSFVQLPMVLGADIKSVMLSVEYIPYIQAPFYSSAAFPIMPQSIIQLSITFKFKKK